MILENKGVLCSAQALTTSAASENVIQLSAVAGGVAPSDLWLSIKTVVAAGTTDALTIDLILATAADMTTGAVVVLRFYTSSGSADTRSGTVGKSICNFNVGKMLAQLRRDLGVTYIYAGLYYTRAGSQTITIDAALSPTEDGYLHTQTVDSNVTVPAVASAGSGE